jgi:hypothetical protein
MLTGAVLVVLGSSVSAYELSDHPRIFVNKAGIGNLAEKSQGAMAAEYALIKAEADRARNSGIRSSDNRFRTPVEELCLGICYLVERQLGHDAAPYAEAIKEHWKDGQILSLDGSGHFGFHALVYDWIYDALTQEERTRFGNALGPWLRWYTDTPEITLKYGHWRYNQTWGPAHLNTPNTRDGITPKLFVALAVRGAGTDHEDDAKRFLDSWAKRVPQECIPAFDEMGGVWSESMGHGNYGPIAVIPWAFEGWRTAIGEDFFQLGAPTTFLKDMTRWAVNLTVPFSNETAWIDDNQADNLSGFARVAPILAARYRDGVANAISDESQRENWHSIPWYRFLFYDPAIPSSTPQAAGYPLATHFQGAGHVYMRSAWGDPNATWAFFGAGPKFAGHSRDDEGHFLIAKKGYLVLRAGGVGHNDSDYYAGGSLAFNIVTIYDPDEAFRRTDPGPRNMADGGMKNENDGGLIRYVYSSHDRDDRGHIVAYQNDARLTYAAADLTQGYHESKVRQVTRQFLYLRGPREFFVIYDRIQATRASFPKTWFLHVPSEPQVSGRETELVPDHVHAYQGDTATWLSEPAGKGPVLSTGRSRAFLKTLLPAAATIVKRGGDGYQLWGNPHEPSAQYNHAGARSLRPPMVPWRLEVEGPGGETRGEFLHVLEVAEEKDSAMSRVQLEETGDRTGVLLDAAGTHVVIRFARRGPLAASFQVADGPEEILGSDR